MNNKIIRTLQISAVLASIVIVLLLAGVISEEPVESVTQESIDSYEEEIRDVDAQNIFEGYSVIDLGKHKVAYLITSDELATKYGYEEWIGFFDLDKERKLYVPAEGKITDIETHDFTSLQISTMFGQEIREIHIPVCFQPETDFIEMLSEEEKVLPSVQPEDVSLPMMVWAETIDIDEDKYEISFERISIPYKFLSDFYYGELSDYRMTVKDMDSNIVQEMILTNLFVDYEDSHWLKDINGDGVPDIILCADDVVGQHIRNTKLVYFVWNKDKRQYEEKPFPKEYVYDPIWNAQESALIIRERAENDWVDNMEMYRFVDGDWQLCAEVLTENDEETPVFQNEHQAEIYYKDLDYHYREIHYEAGIIIEEIVTEESPCQNEQSMWYLEREGNQKLYP